MDNDQSTHALIQRQAGEMLRGEITSEEAQRRMAYMDSERLAEFIVDAIQRGWITRFNLGLNEDGQPV